MGEDRTESIDTAADVKTKDSRRRHMDDETEATPIIEETTTVDQATETDVVESDESIQPLTPD